MAPLSTAATWQWADLLGYGADGRLRFVAEVKAKLQQGNTRYAEQWLREVGEQQPDLYALVVTPAFMGLRLPLPQRLPAPRIVEQWQHATLREQTQASIGSQADYLADSSNSLDLAIDTAQVPLQKLDLSGLQHVVASWLESCLSFPAVKLQAMPSQAWLVESGLHAALRNGSIRSATDGSLPYAFAS